MADAVYRIGSLLFEWNEEKAAGNLRKHAIGFFEAATAFGDAQSVTVHDPDSSQFEDRFLLIGRSAEQRLLVVVHVVRDGIRYRIISARNATRRERWIYAEGE